MLGAVYIWKQQEQQLALQSTVRDRLLPAPEPAIWVLLRGLSRESGHWGTLPASLRAELQAQQPGAELVLLDLPGNGVMHRQDSPTRVHEIVEICRDEMLRRGIVRPIHLLAMSLGVPVASDWAERYPEEVCGMVLINTSLRPFKHARRRVRPLSYLALLLLSLTRHGIREREARVLSLTTRLAQPSEVLDGWVAMQHRRPVGVRNTLRQVLANMRYEASGHRPVAPVLLLCSKGDSLVDWRCSQALSRAWGAPLRLHTKAGHDLPLDDAPWVAQAVADWLRASKAGEVQKAKRPTEVSLS